MNRNGLLYCVTIIWEFMSASPWSMWRKVGVIYSSKNFCLSLLQQNRLTFWTILPWRFSCCSYHCWVPGFTQLVTLAVVQQFFQYYVWHISEHKSHQPRLRCCCWCCISLPRFDFSQGLQDSFFQHGLYNMVWVWLVSFLRGVRVCQEQTSFQCHGFTLFRILIVPSNGTVVMAVTSQLRGNADREVDPTSKTKEAMSGAAHVQTCKMKIKWFNC